MKKLLDKYVFFCLYDILAYSWKKNKEHSKTTGPNMIVAFMVSHFLAGYIRFIIEKGRKKKKQNTGKKLYLRSKNADFDNKHLTKLLLMIGSAK